MSCVLIRFPAKPPKDYSICEDPELEWARDHPVECEQATEYMGWAIFLIFAIPGAMLWWAQL